MAWRFCRRHLHLTLGSMSHRFRLTKTLAVLAAASALAIGALAPTQAQQADAKAAPAEEPVPKFDPDYLSQEANIKVGQTVWSNQCRHCHGNSAYPGKAPKLNPGALAPEFIFDRVTYGFRAMPSWKDVFTTEERKAVVAYIKSPSFSP
jgi:mono/diheme cytochrome c family protein